MFQTIPHSALHIMTNCLENTIARGMRVITVYCLLLIGYFLLAYFNFFKPTNFSIIALKEVEMTIRRWNYIMYNGII